MGKFRTKPVEVEARQHVNSLESAEAIAAWTGGKAVYLTKQSGETVHLVDLSAPDGFVFVWPANWVVEVTEGQFRSGPEGWFRSEYETVEEPSPERVGGFRAIVILPVDNADDASYMLYELYRYGVGGVDNGEKIQFEIDGKPAGLFD